MLNMVTSNYMRGTAVSLCPLLAVFSVAFGGLSPQPPSTTNSSTSPPDQFQLGNSTTKQGSVLLAAPDGNIYQVNISSDKILWSIPTGPPIYDAHQSPNLEDDEHNSSRQQNKFYIDCGGDWQLYIHDKNSKVRNFHSVLKN